MSAQLFVCLSIVLYVINQNTQESKLIGDESKCQKNKKLIRFEWTEVKFALGMNGGYKAGAFRWYVSCCGQAVRQNCCRLQDHF